MKYRVYLNFKMALVYAGNKLSLPLFFSFFLLFCLCLPLSLSVHLPRNIWLHCPCPDLSSPSHIACFLVRPPFQFQNCRTPVSCIKMISVVLSSQPISTNQTRLRVVAQREHFWLFHKCYCNKSQLCNKIDTYTYIVFV